MPRRIVPRPAASTWFARCPHGPRPATLCKGGERNGDDQCRAVEHRFDEEGAAELLDAGDADSKDEDPEHRAPDIDAARLDRGRAEKRAHQRWEQVVEADIG